MKGLEVFGSNALFAEVAVLDPGVLLAGVEVLDALLFMVRLIVLESAVLLDGRAALDSDFVLEGLGGLMGSAGVVSSVDVIGAIGLVWVAECMLLNEASVVGRDALPSVWFFACLCFLALAKIVLGLGGARPCAELVSSMDVVVVVFLKAAMRNSAGDERDRWRSNRLSFGFHVLLF